MEKINVFRFFRSLEVQQFYTETIKVKLSYTVVPNFTFTHVPQTKNKIFTYLLRPKNFANQTKPNFGTRLSLILSNVILTKDLILIKLFNPT